LRYHKQQQEIDTLQQENGGSKAASSQGCVIATSQVAGVALVVAFLLGH
jgi:hypothetical protein